MRHVISIVVDTCWGGLGVTPNLGACTPKGVFLGACTPRGKSFRRVHAKIRNMCCVVTVTKIK